MGYDEPSGLVDESLQELFPAPLLREETECEENGKRPLTNDHFSLLLTYRR